MGAGERGGSAEEVEEPGSELGRRGHGGGWRPGRRAAADRGPPRKSLSWRPTPCVGRKACPEGAVLVAPAEGSPGCADNQFKCVWSEV